jgi:hypothetical protein
MVTREKIKVDCVACPWLIKKFVDPEAEFVFLRHETNWEIVQTKPRGDKITDFSAVIEIKADLAEGRMLKGTHK